MGKFYRIAIGYLHQTMCLIIFKYKFERVYIALDKLQNIKRRKIKRKISNRAFDNWAKPLINVYLSLARKRERKIKGIKK